MIEAIIFDMDGTLVDTEPFNTEIEKRQFSLNQISVSEEEHQKYLGTASEVMWREIAERHHLKIPVNELIEQNHDESLRHFAAIDEIPVMPGLIDLLEKLRAKNFPMAVASSSSPELIDLILSRTNLKKYFQVIISTSEVGKSKPEPDVFLLAAENLGMNPVNCLVVEDSSNGIKAAQAAGMRCVAYEGPGADRQKLNQANAVISNYSQLETLL